MKVINLKKKGSRFEWALRAYFEQNGYLAIRSAGSHTIVDLLVITPQILLLIQAKTTSYKGDVINLFKDEIEELRVVKGPNNCKKEFWVKKNNGKIYRRILERKKENDEIEELPLTLPYEFDIIKFYVKEPIIEEIT